MEERILGSGLPQAEPPRLDVPEMDLQRFKGSLLRLPYSEGQRDFTPRLDPLMDYPYVPQMSAAEGLLRKSVAYQPPFYLSVTVNDVGDYTWSVSSTRSAVTNGTDGTAIDLSAGGTGWGLGAITFDLDTAFLATKYIVLSADIDEDLLPSNWGLEAVDIADTVEVEIDAGPPILQTKVRLLIGKVRVETIDGQLVVDAVQAVTTAQCLGHSFFNGLVVRSFSAAPTHQSFL